jgi:hypothetical protein
LCISDGLSGEEISAWALAVGEGLRRAGVVEKVMNDLARDVDSTFLNEMWRERLRDG